MVDPVHITIPDFSLVVLVGASGSGKSSFARRHFRPTEVLSSDAFRGLVSDDENDQSATADAFAVLHLIAAKRLARARLTVIDATNVQPDSRRSLLDLARRYHVQPVAIVFDIPQALCHERNAARPDRQFGPHVVRRQVQALHRSLGSLQREGFRHILVLHSPEEVDAVTISRLPLRVNRRADHGPFDLIGDVHGCADELEQLLMALGYARGSEEQNGASGSAAGPLAGAGGTLGRPAAAIDGAAGPAPPFVHPAGRKAVFLGDLVDRGPDTPRVLRTIMEMMAAGSALCVTGNHDDKLLRALRGRNVQVSHGLAESLEQLGRQPPEFRERVLRFLDGLISHYVLDDGRLVVAHAGLKTELQGRTSAAVRAFAMYGETTGETDEYGLPVRYNWAAEYRGRAKVVYGHTPVPEPQWLNNTICLDTGCVFGGRLTAMRYPELELVSVPAARVYYEPARPFPANPEAEARSAQQQHDHVLDVEDVLGRRRVETRLHGALTVREENAAAALEVMSRFAVAPHWLVYLPPTMSPAETAKLAGLLEHPAEAFRHFRTEGVPRVILEEKHMGSRAVVIVCRDAEAARRRFGTGGDEAGIVYTRTGRRFFSDDGLERALLARVRAAFDRAGLWQELDSDWALLDCELMPWSAKALELLRTQYAATGAAARIGLSAAVAALHAATINPETAPLLARFAERKAAVDRYTETWRRYCWPVTSLDDLRLAPFHLLATEGTVHIDHDHAWHMDMLTRLCAAQPADGPPLLHATRHRTVDLANPTEEAAGIAWWEELTAAGGEGMVVKPLEFIARGRRGLVQPAVKVRGREYLRLIYGPEYTLPEHLARLRGRGLGAKRSLALREFALGIEGLERFVRREPLRRVHECAFAVLALESEPVDPRL